MNLPEDARKALEQKFGPITDFDVLLNAFGEDLDCEATAEEFVEWAGPWLQWRNDENRGAKRKHSRPTGWKKATVRARRFDEVVRICVNRYALTSDGSITRGSKKDLWRKLAKSNGWNRTQLDTAKRQFRRWKPEAIQFYRTVRDTYGAKGEAALQEARELILEQVRNAKNGLRAPGRSNHPT